jgi:hypothetical protein
MTHSTPADQDQPLTPAELVAVVAEAITESLPAGWTRGWMEVRIADDRVRAAYRFVSDGDEKPRSFAVENELRTIHGMHELQQRMAAEGKVWESAVLTVTSDGGCEAVFMNRQGGVIAQIKSS